MVLGHELVHAWRVDNGMYLQYADEGGPADAAYRYGMARQEELQTTGLFYNAPEHYKNDILPQIKKQVNEGTEDRIIRLEPSPVL